MIAPVAVDVRQWLGDERFMYGPGTESRAKCDAAYAALSELIEADMAYDAATAEYAEAEAGGDDDLICNAIRKLQWAKDRRSTALARCGGAQ